MNAAVLGADLRYEFLRKVLKNAEMTGDFVVTPWPPPENIDNWRNVVTCGPRNSPDGTIDLLLDEAYQQEIARMTAEGAVYSAMTESQRMISDSQCLVSGWGRIGRALAEILKGIGARVTVMTRRHEAFKEIKAGGYTPVCVNDARDAIKGMDLVFSTSPVMTFDAAVLACAEKNALIVDLASPPYGVDLHAAECLGLKAWRERGLPGRYCPASAAMAIYDALVRNGLVKEARFNG